MYRCHPILIKLKQLLHEQKIFGNILSVNAKFYANIVHLFNRRAGGSIMDLGCYQVSLLRFVCGTEPYDNVTGHATIVQPSQSDHSPFDSTATAHITLPSKYPGAPDITSCIISSNDNPVRTWEFNIICEHGEISVSNLWDDKTDDALILSHYDTPSADLPTRSIHHVESIVIPIPAPKDFYVLQIDTVNTHIRQGLVQATSPAMNWEDSINNMKVLDNWRKAIGLKFNVE